MKLGFIIPNYPDEKRVAIIPEDIYDFKDEIYIEKNFGKNMGILDYKYEKVGCNISTRDKIFENCDIIFSLKLIQKTDYEKLRNGCIIIGWTHPTGSGKEFMKIAQEKNITIIDLDNIYPAIYKNNKVFKITQLKKNFIRKNSEIAGFSASLHALLNYGELPDSNTKVAILSIGNVAQGCLQIFAKFNANIRVFKRNTMDEFKEKIHDFDIIVNGIEISEGEDPILTMSEQKKLKKGCLIIDAAADAGKAIAGSHYTTISNPIYEYENKYYYVVNNAPSILYREASKEISKSLSKNILRKGIKYFLEEITQ